MPWSAPRHCEEVDMRSNFHRIVRGGGARLALTLMLGAPKKW